MSRGKSAGLFTGDDEKKRGIVLEDRHDGFFGIVLISPETHSIDCHLKAFPSKNIVERFLYDLAWVLDYEVAPVGVSKARLKRERENERKLTQARKELRELKNKK